jgi:NTP pyrophosphatase (non-canonical NTP hydrolase)
MTIKEWQKELHQGAVDRGFYDNELGEKTPVRIASMLAMVHSEVSEALEELRVGEVSTKFIPQGSGSPPPADFLPYSVRPPKPIGFPSELADVIIRVLDMAEWLGIDLEEEIRLKNEYNKTRGYRHGDLSL